uniref:Uncharacterized protein n=1 Tax=Rhizophora mucronata TaxID=61149 RepID=A0A2P2QNH5_RHIMU
MPMASAKFCCHISQNWFFCTMEAFS